MKPGRRIFWATNTCALLRGLATVALTLFIAACGSEPSNDAATHFTRAQLLVTAVPEGKNFAQPPHDMPGQALPQAGWQAVSLPHRVAGDKQAQPGAPNGVHWYRLDVTGPATLGAPRYLYLPRAKNAGQIAVYGNGRLLYRTQGSLAYNGFNRPLLLQLDNTPPAQQTTLLVRLEQPAGGRSTISTLWVGSSHALAWRHQGRLFLQMQLPFMGSAGFLVIGIFSLAIWTRYKREWLYLILFAAAAMAFLRLQHYVSGGRYLFMSDAWFTWVTVVSAIWLVVLINIFLQNLYRRTLPWLNPAPINGSTKVASSHRRRWVNPALIVMVTLFSLTLIPGVTSLIPDLEAITPTLYLILVPLVLILAGFSLRTALQGGTPDARPVVAMLWLAVPSSIYDLALQNNWVSPEGLYTSPYVIMGLFFVFSYVLYGRYISAMDRAEKVNVQIAEQLQNREAELAISYENLREVERRQTINNERLRLSQDMHDGLGSSLVSALRVVESGRMNDAELGDVLKGCIDDLKLTLDSMESVDADLLLLLATLRFRLGPRLSSAGIILKWEVTDLPKLDWLDSRNTLHIMRIFQETFANVLKHTKTNTILVSTTVQGSGEDAGIAVSIEDNGQGFDVAATLAGHLGRGLHNQQRRAQSIGATASWTSSALGTRFTLWLPVQRPGNTQQN